MPRKRKTASSKKPSNGTALTYLERIQSKGDIYLYYRRGGKRIPLAGPEGSDAFHISYQAAAAKFAPRSVEQERTVAYAITAYMDSADFAQLSPASQRDYRYYFRTFSGAFGHMSMLAMDEGKLHAIRNAYKSKPNQWNAIRARMKAVTEHFMALHRGAMPVNPWVLSKRLKVKQSDANKPWPRDVLERVFAAASPQFRALLTVYLLTAQRGSDVTTFNAAQYDRQARTITFRQKKTDTAMTLHVPDALAEIFEAAPGVGPAKLPRLATRARQTGSLLLTPRGYPWTLDNAQQTLAALLKRLELPRYTLHGLRSTGPTALRQEGWANPALRPLTGHNSDSNLEVYLRHADTAPLTRQAQEALSDLFGGLVAKPVPNRQTGDGSEAA